MRARGKTLVWLGTACCLGLWWGACSDDSSSSGDAAVTWDAAGDAGREGDGAVPGDAVTDGSSEGCQVGQSECLSMDRLRRCRDEGGTPAWVEEACPEHSYCLTDHCEEACLDECFLGETRNANGEQQTCRIYDVASQTYRDPGAGTHDLARLHDAWTRAKNLANGYICETLFTDDSHSQAQAYLGTVDAAEWTGTYLAAEALRLMTSPSPEAESMVEYLTEKVCDLFGVTGAPGSMARFWAPLGVDPLYDAIDDPGDFSFHHATYQGQSVFWHGWTSRDMYSGAMLGLSLAYDALRSEAHRARIRSLVVPLAMELIQQRSNVPVTVRFNAFGSWQEQDLTFDMENVVLVPEEMEDGRISIQVGSESDPQDYGSSELKGAREFMPDFQPLLSQVPVIGGLVPAIPRPGSAMMLAEFLLAAIHMCDGVADLGDEQSQIQAYYDAHIDGWIDVMGQYAYHNADQCWSQYFGLTIAFHSMYGLLRLETDQGRKARIQQALSNRMWPVVSGHKNPYFAYITASQGQGGTLSTSELDEIGLQLAQFVPPPKTRRLVDNRGSYPADADCGNMTNVPIDVGTRVPSDFLWQHHPFMLVTPEPLDRLVFPAADYLVAYWMGRYHGLLEDDAPQTCLRWSP